MDTVIEVSPTEEYERDTNSNSNANRAEIRRSFALLLYLSHFLSTWNSRLFEFAAVLFLAAVYPNTLREISIYAVVRSAAAILFAQTVANWIDQKGRLLVMQTSIVGQRLAVLFSCLIFWSLEKKVESNKWELKTSLFAIVIILASIEKVCATMNLISMERDWVVVITEGNENSLRVLNSRMRRIDLVCKLLGPLAISFIQLASNTSAIWATFGMNALSVGIEYFAIQKVYQRVSALHATHSVRLLYQSQTPEPSFTILKCLNLSFKTIVPLRSLAYYLKNSAFLPSFALSLLYLTVLSFSGQMITYLISVGYSSLYVGLARAISTIFEISATWISPRLSRRIGIIRGGLWSISWQMFWLAGGISFFLLGLGKYGQTSFVPATGLAISIAFSRIGLWSFDLCAQNIVQNEVEFGRRGAFSSSEAAFQNLFEMLSYAVTIIFSRPDQFKWPVVISVAAVYLAGALYTFFVRRRRRHLFHASACIPVKSRTSPGPVTARR